MRRGVVAVGLVAAVLVAGAILIERAASVQVPSADRPMRNPSPGARTASAPSAAEETGVTRFPQRRAPEFLESQQASTDAQAVRSGARSTRRPHVRHRDVPASLAHQRQPARRPQAVAAGRGSSPASSPSAARVPAPRETSQGESKSSIVETSFPRPEPHIVAPPAVAPPAASAPAGVPQSNPSGIPDTLTPPVPLEVPPPAHPTPYRMVIDAPGLSSSARLEAVQARVRLRLVIRADGTTRGAEIAVPSGRAELDAAAMNAVSQWRFLPARRHGEAIESVALIWVAFIVAP